MVVLFFRPGFACYFEPSMFPWSWGELLWDALGVDTVVLFPLRDSEMPSVGVRGGHSIVLLLLSSLVCTDFDSDSPLCLVVNSCWMVTGIHGLTLAPILAPIQYDLIKFGMVATNQVTTY